MDINTEFVPYEQALDLNDLGFNLYCLAEYRQWDGSGEYLHLNEDESTSTNYTVECKAPLYQQAFKWLRDVYGLTWEHQFDDSMISLYVGEITYPDTSLEFFKSIEVEYNAFSKAYTMAELECLKKLIEIAKSLK